MISLIVLLQRPRIRRSSQPIKRLFNGNRGSRLKDLGEMARQLNHLWQSNTHRAPELAICKSGAGRAIHHNSPLVHQQDAIDPGHYLVHLVLNQHDGHTKLPVEQTQHIQHFLGTDRVEVRGRLVKHEHGRAHGQRRRNGYTLLLTAGEREYLLMAHALHACVGQRLLSTLPDLIPGQAEVFRPEGYFFLHTQLHQLVIGVLKDNADALRDLVNVPLKSYEVFSAYG